MEEASYWLPLVWAAVIGAAVVLYVILDGFDLGLGILFTVHPEERDRDVMMNTVAPFWDGNETWLVLGGGGLLAAFPLAYAVIMPAVYIPVIVMLLALVLRGVAFEFRWVAKPSHRVWDLAFAGGSIAATFMQGVILGSILDGIEVRNAAFAGGPLDWLSPFCIFTGLALLAGYGLLGATWLIMKADEALAEASRRHARVLLGLVLVSMAVISLWTPLRFERIYERWFSLPNFILLAPVPLLTAYAAWSCWRGLELHRPVQPFVSAIALFLLGFVGLLVSNAPYLVPPTLTVWDTAAAPSSQEFLLVGVLVLLPVILGYTAFVYWTFRGRTRHGEGYH